MHGWKFLVSLVKAKLLANDGRGRKLTIMCGGLLSQTYEKTLRRYPGTLLTSMVLEEDGPLFYSDKVYLDRHPLAFVEILNAYREGVIAEQPTHIAPETWIHELVHFRMHRANIPAINNLLDRYGVHVKKVSSNTAQTWKLRCLCLILCPAGLRRCPLPPFFLAHNFVHHADHAR